MKALRNINLFFVLLVFMLSCSTIDSEIPEDADAEDVLILAQKQQSKAISDDDYHAVMQIYLELLRMYPEDIENGVVAKYEIGFIFLKLKDNEEAKKWFQDVIELYENFGLTIPGYPVWTFKLAEIMLKEIEENEKG